MAELFDVIGDDRLGGLIVGVAEPEVIACVGGHSLQSEPLMVGIFFL
jgi:hypothetical protein